ncbi:ABC transporter substrate-binding protein [Streptomyces sp. NBC_00299]|uniref:ABC transporter substrate-binding protein n=1 Tax=Streptomyces sp. NBC_00299 TaxID=2975705 RepID=UPI002E2A151E|nr:extracellular solute-binding protein [Streptomyces sp. NBC_00299]
MATSANDAGGMDALIAAAKREGTLNALGIAREWAGYGALIDGFERQYGITVRNEKPSTTSTQDKFDALKNSRKGQAHAPDVIAFGDTYPRAAAQQNLLAPYKVAAYDAIPANQKDPQARWTNNYGGYTSIGCDAGRVKQCPRTFADLLKPQYKGMVAIESDPIKNSSAIPAVYAAALANGGSFDDVGPGIEFFVKLKSLGNLYSGPRSETTINDGKIPILIDHDFYNLDYADKMRSKGVEWKVSIPFDGSFAQYYAFTVNKHAPHPAAARLWMEWVFSPEGQNIRLNGYARPVLMQVMEEDGTLDKAAAARMPAVEGTPQFPTDKQLEKARKMIAKGWPEGLG